MCEVRRVGNALLCLFSGETDCAVAVIVESEEALRSVIVENWTGDPDSDETKSALQAIAEHNFCDESVLCFEAEIGEATFRDVFTYIAASTEQQKLPCRVRVVSQST